MKAMGNRFRRLMFACLTLATLAMLLGVWSVPSAAARAETATTFDWTCQFGLVEYEPVCLAVESGAACVANQGLLRRYDAGGSLVWERDLDDVGGQEYLHQVTSISAGAGGVCVAGSIWCNPETSSGDFCGGFIRKYTAAGGVAWTHYPETDIFYTGGWAVHADASGVYLAGNWRSWDSESGGGFLRKYDANGSEVWRRDLEAGTPDTCWGVCADSTGVYVSGNAPHEMAEADAWSRFVCKYAADGTWLWTREYDWAGESSASPVCAGSGAFYLADGRSDAFHKHDSSGTRVWSRQIGQEARVLALEARGGAIYVAGSLSRTLPGQSGQGGDDAFLARYDADGNRDWVRQFGSSGDDAAQGVVVPGNGAGIFVAGSAGSALPGSRGAGGGFLALVTANAYPERPVNASPADGAAGVSLSPTLQGSAFSDSDGDSHDASRWQVRSDSGDYDNPVWDSGAGGAFTSVAVPAGKLDYSATYYWRVGYRDSRGLWSAYSAETSFTTADAVAAALTVETLAAEGIGPGGATLRLNLAWMGATPSVQVSFEWGTGPEYGNGTPPREMTATGAASFDLDGLSPATTYHFRAKAEGGGTAYGSDLTFTTAATGREPVLGGLEASSGRQGDEMTVSITGTNLTGATEVDFGAGIVLQDYQVLSDTELTAWIVIAGEAETGERTVSVTTPWGTGQVRGFTVNDAVPRVRLWVYLVGAAAGAVVLGILATGLGLLIQRRQARQQ